MTGLHFGRYSNSAEMQANFRLAFVITDIWPYCPYDRYIWPVDSISLSAPKKSELDWRSFGHSRSKCNDQHAPFARVPVVGALCFGALLPLALEQTKQVATVQLARLNKGSYGISTNIGLKGL